ncbi:hypothetical protein V6255_06030 [Psychromonas arctica]|uniref:Uncharacterized protein n=1 Tax=Psychromonas arctica TaxID=168275 RepID=A0ABU9HA03_9GAMM
MLYRFAYLELRLLRLIADKGSLYKAIFEEFSHYVDFYAVMVTSLDFNVQQLTLSLCQDLFNAMLTEHPFIYLCSFTKQSASTLISD